MIPGKVARVVSMTVAELESLASALDTARKAQLTEIDSERSGAIRFFSICFIKSILDDLSQLIIDILLPLWLS